MQGGEITTMGEELDEVELAVELQDAKDMEEEVEANPVGEGEAVAAPRTITTETHVDIRNKTKPGSKLSQIVRREILMHLPVIDAGQWDTLREIVGPLPT